MLLMLMQCTEDAPRDNPLDPLSAIYRPINAIIGKCTTVYSAAQIVPGVEIDLFPFSSQTVADTSLGFETTTNDDGEFVFERLAPGKYLLRFRKEGFAEEKLEATLDAGKVFSVDVGLDQLPVIDSLRLSTVFSELNDAGQTNTNLETFFGVSDPDRTLDIENLTLTIPDHSISKDLTPGRDRDKWETVIPLDSTSLAGKTEKLLGAPIFIDIETETNSKRRSTRYGPFFITRFVRHEVQIISPRDNITVGQRPTFLWPEPHFPFSYKTAIDAKRIISFDTFEEFLFENIQDTTLTPFVNLTVGDYFWVLEFEDEFGNKSRTKPATFKIRANE